MSEFYKLIRLLTSMTGFLVVAAIVLARGDALFTAALRAVLTFAVVYYVLGFLQGLLAAVAGSITTAGSVDLEQR
jgi:hypothetical protein